MNKITKVCMAMLIYSTSYAQHRSESDILLNEELTDSKAVTWGLKAGWNYNKLYGNGIDYIFSSKETEYQSGFHTGIFVNTSLFGSFGLKHELVFNKKYIGVSLTDWKGENYSSNLVTSNIELMPASLTFYKGRFLLNAGPYVSALFRANLNRRGEDGRMFKDKSIFGAPDNDETEKRYLQKFDFGMNAGLEYQFDSGLLIGARYTHGFTDIFQYANSYTNEDIKTDNIKIHSKGFMLWIGYVFN